MKKEQWDQVVSLAGSVYKDRRFLKAPSTDDLVVHISPRDGVSINDVYNHLSIGSDAMLLNGHPITTRDDKQTSKDMLDRFFSIVQYDLDKEMKQMQQKRRSVIQLAIHHDPQNIDLRQLASLRSAHPQWSRIGEKHAHLQLDKALRRMKWPPTLVQKLSPRKKKSLLSNKMEKGMGLALIEKCKTPTARNIRDVYHLSDAIFSQKGYKDKRFLWYFISGSNEAEKHYYELVCIARCVLDTDTPGILCMFYWGSTRQNQPYTTTNTYIMFVFDTHHKETVLKQRVSADDFNTILEKIVQKEPVHDPIRIEF